MVVAAAVSVGPRFSIGRTIADAFRVLRLNFFPFALVALVAHLMWLLLPEVAPMQSQPANLGDLAIDILRTLAGLLISCLPQLGLAYGTVRTLLGRRGSTADIWTGFGSVVPAFMAGVISYAPVFAIDIAERTLGGHPIALGFIAPVLVVALIYCILNFWLTTPIIAIERKGVLAALGRSCDLARGCRWKIVAIWLVVGVMVVATAALASVATGQGLLELAESKPTTVSGAVWFVMALAWSAFFATLTNVAYFHMRTEKDGVADHVVQVFD